MMAKVRPEDISVEIMAQLEQYSDEVAERNQRRGSRNSCRMSKRNKGKFPYGYRRV